jgi:hypothetical protein
VDAELLVFGSCLVALAAVLAALGMRYAPELAPLPAPQTQSFRVISRTIGVVGLLFLGGGAVGFGGFLVVGVTVVALATARF